jgi:mRNA-degrading endonuclease YafQ of YafQ-DinJ toxin-antitoxin module
MLIVSVTPQFRRMFKKLEYELQEEALEKLEQLKNPTNHLALKVHKLKGIHSKRYSFSVNHKTRVVFSYVSATEVVLMAIGSHDVYK